MKTLIIILFASFVVACNQSFPLKSKAVNDEYAVINLAIRAILPTHERFKNMANGFCDFQTGDFLQPTPYDSKEWTTYRRHEYDSLKAVLDTATVYLNVADTLKIFFNGDLSNFKNRNLAKLKLGGDSLEILKQIVNDVDAVTNLAVLDKSQIDPIYDYRIIFGSKQSVRPTSYFTAGKLSFSRVCFNSTKTEACVYARNRCGNLCGTEQLLFFVKQGSHWQLFYQWLLSIS